MPPFIRDDVPFVWCQEEQNQEQNQDNNLNAEPIQEDNELSSDDQALDVALLQVRAAVERNAVEADRAGINVVAFHQRNAVYSSLLFEFVSAVDRKIALNREPATAETAIEHSALTAQINRLVREVCEFNISYN
ncbi:uncharacterized protein [Drosophila pseudoobscura]|uniref:Uncharacterized protein n=1 Tax=Drosophila pseudoobscura pseudoobscura TaxID=46245 RepID=A0A6I8WBQ4_DROPS|nr:uncharacterized protein LOC6901775 [Drosophila pseudoobscura]